MKRSSLFLLELISMILLFSICAAVCVSLLGKAWGISRQSDRLTHAVYLAETAAAHIQADLPYTPEAVDGYAVQTAPGNRQDGLSSTLITVRYEGEIVYELAVSHLEGLS